MTCSESSFRENLKTTLTTRLELVADILIWHPSGGAILVTNQKGDIQVLLLMLIVKVETLAWKNI